MRLTGPCPPNLGYLLRRHHQSGCKYLVVSGIIFVIWLFSVGLGSLQYVAPVCLVTAASFLVVSLTRFSLWRVKCPRCSKRLIHDAVNQNGRLRIAVECARCSYRYLTEVELS